MTSYESPNNKSKEIPTEDLEEVESLRYDLSYLVYKIRSIIGFNRLFSVLGKRIEESLNGLKGENDVNLNVLCKLEAELYCLSGALKKMDDKDADTVGTMQKMLELLFAFNYQKQRMLKTALKVVSRSSEFFGTRADLLQSGFKFLANCINITDLEDLASESISNLCKNNKGFVLENMNDFVDCSLFL